MKSPFRVFAFYFPTHYFHLFCLKVGKKLWPISTLGSDLFLYAVHSTFVFRIGKFVELLIQQPAAGAYSIDNVDVDEAGDFCVFI